MNREPIQQNAKLFDQFKLSEQLGFVGSSMAMLILRNLLRKDTWGEGDLAARVGCRIFRPEWRPLIEALHTMGYVSFKPTGHALTRTVSITDLAKEFLTEKEIEAEPDEVVEQPTEVGHGTIDTGSTR